MSYLSNLPPGCTSRMEDEATGGDPAEWGCAECGANIWDEDDLYRCVDCGEELCAQCSTHPAHAEPLCAACCHDCLRGWPAKEAA